MADEYIDPQIGNPRGYPDEPCETWHVHDDGGWEWGAVCGVCVAAKPVAVAGGPYFNVAHLHRQNVMGTTTAEEVRDVLSNIKPEDRDKYGRA